MNLIEYINTKIKLSAEESAVIDDYNVLQMLSDNFYLLISMTSRYRYAALAHDSTTKIASLQFLLPVA